MPRTADRIVDGMHVFYLGLVIGTFGLRAARDWHAKRVHAVRITYPGHSRRFRAVGFLRAGSKPLGRHSARVGLRRPRPLLDLQSPHCPGHADGSRFPVQWNADTLRRIAAPPPVRLACQLRPSTDISVESLVPIGESSASVRPASTLRSKAAGSSQIAAMFVDLRGSTRLATDRLPYDALFLFDRYIQAVTGAIRRNGGHTTSIAGDGVMSVFGVDTTAAVASGPQCVPGGPRRLERAGGSQRPN